MAPPLLKPAAVGQAPGPGSPTRLSAGFGKGPWPQQWRSEKALMALSLAGCPPGGGRVPEPRTEGYGGWGPGKMGSSGSCVWYAPASLAAPRTGAPGQEGGRGPQDAALGPGLLVFPGLRRPRGRKQGGAPGWSGWRQGLRVTRAAEAQDAGQGTRRRCLPRADQEHEPQGQQCDQRQQRRGQPGAAQGVLLRVALWGGGWRGASGTGTAEAPQRGPVQPGTAAMARRAGRPAGTTS